MADQPSGKIWGVHKIAAAVMIVTAVVLVVQLGLILSMTDDTRLEMIKVGARMERDRHVYSPLERPLTDEELDKRISEQKADLLRKHKEQTQTPGLFMMKPLMALLLAIVAFGLLTHRRSPTRVVAIIMTILLLIGTIGAFNNFSEERGLQKYVTSPSALLQFYFLADLAMLIMVSLSLVFSLITAVKPPSKPEAPPAAGTST
jgi:hypothetical protein